MITFIKGKLVEKAPTFAVIEAQGVGYFLNISLNTFTALKSEESAFLYTHLAIKEDAHTLYGFYSKMERELFRLLISVSGVGASIARTMLSSMTTKEIQQAIASGDVQAIQSIKGIGSKTAQRLLVDLKDKIAKYFDEGEQIPSANSTLKTEAISALEVLGFSKKQCEKVISQILTQTPEIDVETLIKKALKNI